MDDQNLLDMDVDAPVVKWRTSNSSEKKRSGGDKQSNKKKKKKEGMFSQNDFFDIFLFRLREMRHNRA